MMSTRKIALYVTVASIPVALYLLTTPAGVHEYKQATPAQEQPKASQAIEPITGMSPKTPNAPTAAPAPETTNSFDFFEQPDADTAIIPRNSMEKARLYGDPRTPPIERPKYTREMPTEEELADPDLYQEYETRQIQKVYQSFYKESKKKLALMEELVERGRREGVPEEQLREGEEKIAAMKAMRKKLAEEHDDLSDE